MRPNRSNNDTKTDHEGKLVSFYKSRTKMSILSEKLRKRKAIDPPATLQRPIEMTPWRNNPLPTEKKTNKKTIRKPWPLETNSRKSKQKRIAKWGITSTKTTSLKHYYRTCTYKSLELIWDSLRPGQLWKKSALNVTRTQGGQINESESYTWWRKANIAP